MFRRGCPQHRGLSNTQKSVDPNEMVGPEGTGEQRYVKPGEWMNYTIYFENKADAATAAQKIWIDNKLSRYLDWSTFEMGEVSLAGRLYDDVVGAAPTAAAGEYNGYLFEPRNTKNTRKEERVGSHKAYEECSNCLAAICEAGESFFRGGSNQEVSAASNLALTTAPFPFNVASRSDATPSRRCGKAA